jgi:hypothetical protein
MAEYDGGRLGQLHGELRGQQTVRQPSDTVSSK